MTVECSNRGFIPDGQRHVVRARRGGRACHYSLRCHISIYFLWIGIAHIPDKAVRANLFGYTRIFFLSFLLLIRWICLICWILRIFRLWRFILCLFAGEGLDLLAL